MTLHHRASASTAVHNADAFRGPVVPLKRSFWQRTKDILPILHWLPRYQMQNLKFDIAAGITVAMMLIPQEVSLASIMNVRPENGLYTAATAPLVYALFGSSTVLSVASGSEVSLLVGSALHDIKDEKQRIATGVFTAFFIGLLLLVVRFLNLAQVADFFSRPVMGGYISAGGLLIMLSQVQNLFSVKIEHAPFPPQMVYKLAQQVNKIEKHGFLVGIFSILFLVLLRVIKKRFFPSPVLMQLFNDEAADTKMPIDANAPILTPVTDGQTTHQGGHGFSLTDAQYVDMNAEEQEATPPRPLPKTKTLQWFYFLASTLCDLGPLMVCVAGAIVGYALGPKKIKLTGHVPGGFPVLLEPWYGFNNGLIPEGELGTIIVRALPIAVVVYLTSIAMAKRLAIQRGEDIRTDQELLGLGVAGVVCGFLRAMPPTGGMSRTAVNLQNAKTQLSSIITVFIIILSLYTLTGTLYYLPKSTLAAIIIVAGWALVEFKEAKWLFRVRRDEFWVWTASFIFTLGLGVMYGLAASIVASLVALMYKTKRAPVVILGQLDNGSFVDREQYADAKHLLDVVVLRVENTVYFANSERVASFVDEELARLAHEGVTTKGVVVDVSAMNDLDATTLQVFSDMQEKLAFRKIGFAVANAKGKVHDIIASTNLLKRLAGSNPRIPIDGAIRYFRDGVSADSNATSPASSDHAV
jgi:sulfate permease, SulP family